MPLTKATTNVVNLDKDTIINTLTAGRGAGNLSTNTVFGRDALQSNTIGYNNVAIGPDALQLNTIGVSNVAIGVQALEANVDGDNNTAVGRFALILNTSGANNVAIGSNALPVNTSGTNNVAIGVGALFANIGGSNNTALGVSAFFTGASRTNCTALGSNAVVTADNQVQLGDLTTNSYYYNTISARSDIRDKTDIRDTTLGLEFVNALRPVDFKWDYREAYRPEAPKTPEQDATEEEKAAYKVAKDKWLEDVKLANITHDGSKKRIRFHHGLIAQEVKAVLDSKGIDFGGFQDHSVKGGDDVLTIGYEELIAPLIKAVQELSAEIAALKAK